jgi:hypothetical protein
MWANVGVDLGHGVAHRRALIDEVQQVFGLHVRQLHIRMLLSQEKLHPKMRYPRAPETVFDPPPAASSSARSV